MGRGLLSTDAPRRSCLRRVPEYFAVKTLAIADYAMALACVLSLFTYDSGWTGVSEAHLVWLRLFVVLISLAIAVARLWRSSLTGSCKIAVVYGACIAVLAVFSPVNPGNGLVQGLNCISVFLCLYYLTRRYGYKRTIDILFWTLTPIVFLTSTFVIATNGQGFLTWETEWTTSSNYIFAGKFTTSYLLMFYIALLFAKTRRASLSVIVAAFFVVLCSMMECSTGIVGMAIILLLIFFKVVASRIASVPSFIPAVIVAMAILAVVGGEVLEVEVVRHVVVDVLGESSDLTGRTGIYPHLLQLWLQRPLFGYGSYGAANMAVYNACGAPDAQEGLFHILLANGVVGAVLFLALCYSIAKDCKEAGVASVTNPMLAYLVAMAICSYVEINLAGLFLLGLSLMHCYSLSKPETVPRALVRTENEKEVSL